MAKNQPDAKRPFWVWTPSLGLILFIWLFITAAWLYPGGSKTDRQAPGFSMTHNYWCDLFDNLAYNGAKNPSRPIAILAMVVLSCSFGILWYLLPDLVRSNRTRKRLIRFSGIGSMAVASFLFTGYHEEVIHIGGLLGGLALTLTFMEFYRANKKGLFISGLACLGLSLLNYFIYETGVGLSLLASLQKITFLVFFTWAIRINYDLSRQKQQG